MLAGSPNFSLTEVRQASHSVPWASVQAEPIASRVARTLTLLERVRATLGHRPVTVTSLVRSPEFNRSEGGSETSAHLSGYGADIVVRGMTPREVFLALRPAVVALGIDQLVYEGDHVHISSDPRGRAMVIDLTGTLGGALAAPADATRYVPSTGSPTGCTLALVALASPWALGFAVFCYLTLSSPAP